MPAIPSGLEGGQIDLVPGEGFWARIEQIAVKGEMTRGLDTAMHGRPSPRIWLFLHEPGRGELSAAVAMSFARELAFRDQAALVLDCDDQNQALTRWAGRVEAEGWIDLARYGTSVLTSGMPMPFVGRRGYLLGVGSFAPTDVTGEEVDTLLTRLRRQADDLLLVAPSDSTGLLWAPASAIRILCWDRQTVPSEKAAEVAERFEQADCPLTAVVIFQETGVAAERLVDDVLAEVELPQEPAQPEEPVAEEPIFEEPVAEESEEVPADPPEVDIDADAADAAADDVVETNDTAGSEKDKGWKDLPLEQEAESDPEGDSPGWDREDVEEPLSEPITATAGVRETSRVFWFGALAVVAVLVVFSVYYFKYVRVPAEGHFQEIDIAEVTESPGRDPEVQVRDETGSGEMDVPTTALDSVAVPAEIVGDTLATTGDADLEEVDPGDAEPGDETPAEVAETPTAGFDMGPYREPVGTKGWALHVYSLPDSPGTAREVKELDRRGFRSEVRIFDLGEKGRWFRIYLGSFASRSEAKQAMPALLEKLKEDWAKPERFEISAPE